MAVTVTFQGATHLVEIVRRRPKLVLKVDGRLHEIDEAGPPGTLGHGVLSIDGERVRFARVVDDGRALLRLDGRTFEADCVDPETAEEDAGGALDVVQAPMPGAVVSVHKAPGDPVARGETVVTIESMKLQTQLVAPRDGVVEAIAKAEGETFEKDEVVARLAPEGEEG